MYSLVPLCKAPANVKLGPSVALANPQFPSYLEGAPIVVRISTHEVTLSDSSIWVLPMREAFPACVEENLRRLPGTLEVNSDPRAAKDYDRLVQIEVIDFTKNSSAQVLLDVIWRISFLRDRKPLITRRKSYKIPVLDEEYASIAAASSEAMAKFCIDLAADLRKE